MPKLNCRCGYTFKLGVSPKSNSYQAIPENNIEQAGQYVKNKNSSYDGLLDILDKDSYDILICKNCERIYLLHPKENTYKIYITEKPKD